MNMTALGGYSGYNGYNRKIRPQQRRMFKHSFGVHHGVIILHDIQVILPSITLSMIRNT